jgi:hypothetical protein
VSVILTRLKKSVKRKPHSGARKSDFFPNFFSAKKKSFWHVQKSGINRILWVKIGVLSMRRSRGGFGGVLAEQTGCLAVEAERPQNFGVLPGDYGDGGLRDEYPGAGRSYWRVCFGGVFFYSNVSWTRRKKATNYANERSFCGATLTPACRGAKRARDWRGAKQPRRIATGPERVSAEPRKARFFAEQKMRPNFEKSW